MLVHRVVAIQGETEARPEQKANVPAGNYPDQSLIGNDADIFMMMALEPFIDIFRRLRGLDELAVFDQGHKINIFKGY
jgi:hypothetical protein